jgi:hypothetical protein
MQVSTWKAKAATAPALQKKHNPDVLFMKTNRFVFVFAAFSALIFPSSLPAFEGRMHAAPGGDDDNFRELVCVQTKWLLWFTAFHRNRKSIRMKPVFSFKD